MTGISNRELQDRNAPETSRWCASLTSSAPLGELACGPIGRAPKMAGKEAGVSGTDTKLRPRLAMSPSRPGFHPRPRRGCSPDPRGYGRRPAARSKRRSRASVMCATGRHARLRHGGPGRSRSSYTRTTRASFPNHSSRSCSEASAGSFPRAGFSLSCSWRIRRATTR
jgi:hypothetical protein